MKDNDLYYMQIAKQVATRSKCHSRHVGAVLVQNDRIVATGFNGPPMGMRPCDRRWVEDGLYEKEQMFYDSVEHVAGQCPRRFLGYSSGTALWLCPAAHAERNALLSASLNGVSTKGSTLYAYCCRPCKDCMVEIVNAGVSRLVFLKSDKAYDELSWDIMKECGLQYREVDML